MNLIGTKIKDLRKSKGWSQEELAEASKVNLRTIQRIEKNENEPRGKTLLLICEALEVNPRDILEYEKKENNSHLALLHLSILSFLIIPLGNIIVPLIIWLTQKDKTKGVKEAGINILNFQILWSFLCYGLVISFIMCKFVHIDLFGFGSFTNIVFILILFYAFNIIIPIVSAVRINYGKSYIYPNWIKIIK